MILAYFLAASFEASSLLAPVQTILPEANISAVVLGSRILMMTAANRCFQSELGDEKNYLWVVFRIAGM
jgi:hypothetical protein